MAGLLDFLNTDQGRMGLGLLAAAGPRTDGAGFGQRLQEGMGSFDAYKQSQLKTKHAEMQMQEYEQGLTQKQQAAAEQARIRGIVSQGGTDWQGMIRAGVPLDLVKQLAESQNFGRNEVARTMDVEGPNGAKMTRSFDKFGQQVVPDVNGYVAPQLIDQGDRKTFAKPMLGASFPVGMSPEGRDASARGWAGVNQSAARLSFDKSNTGGKAPAGYRYTQTGDLEAIPGGPADLKAGQAGVAKSNDAREALSVIAEAENLIPKSTGSGIGALVDSAAGFVGASPAGAQAGARLKALEGMLVSKMPKMSGPQSDKDVLLYKQMAGQIGDTSLPVATRMAALETIKAIQQQYGGTSSGGATGSFSGKSSGGWSIQKAD